MKESFTFYGMTVRPDIIESLNAWVMNARPVGGFLEAVLENNLVAAMSRADDENLRTLPAVVAYVYNELPSLCWGNPAKVKAWPDLLEAERGNCEGTSIEQSE